ELENLSTEDVVVTSVAASVGGAGASGDLCSPPVAAMSPDDNHNHQPLVAQPDSQQSASVSPGADKSQNSESLAMNERRIFAGNDQGGAEHLGLEGLLMVEVRDGAVDGQGVGGDSEVSQVVKGAITTEGDVLEVPRRRQMLRKGLLGEEEEKILQEYLQRSDTAVIFPEPVEQGKFGSNNRILR
ncbi:hypothetical protein L9F63_020442, partial [Diploptera punctata]